MVVLAEAAREADCPYRIALVASDKPDAPGLSLARDMGVPTFALSPKGIGKAAFEAALDTALRGASVELIALAGYMRLLSPAFVAQWRGRILNIHPSLLPKYKGLDTHARAGRGRCGGRLLGPHRLRGTRRGRGAWAGGGADPAQRYA